MVNCCLSCSLSQQTKPLSALQAYTIGYPPFWILLDIDASHDAICVALHKYLQKAALPVYSYQQCFSFGSVVPRGVPIRGRQHLLLVTLQMASTRRHMRRQRSLKNAVWGTGELYHPRCLLNQLRSCWSLYMVGYSPCCIVVKWWCYIPSAVTIHACMGPVLLSLVYAQALT